MKQIVFSNEGRSHKINANDDKSVREIMSGQAALTDRYIKVEPAISAAFGAPACFQKKTEQREDLIAYLQSRHPNFENAEKVDAQRDAAKAKGDPTLAHRLSLDAAAEWNRIHTDVANAIRAMKKYFEAGNKGERKTRTEQSPRELMETLRNKLAKIAESTDWTDADRKLAKKGVTALNGVIGAPVALGLTVAQPVAHPERAAGKVVDVTAEYTETAGA